MVFTSIFRNISVCVHKKKKAFAEIAGVLWERAYFIPEGYHCLYNLEHLNKISIAIHVLG